MQVQYKEAEYDVNNRILSIKSVYRAYRLQHVAMELHRNLTASQPKEKCMQR
jgi:hypothetical protein